MPLSKSKSVRKLTTVSPLFQTIFVFISVMCISTAFYKQFGKFHFHDEKPNIFTITPKDYKTFGQFASPIQVGLEIAQYDMFDVVNNKFVFSGIVWFKFYPGTISTETLELFRFERAQILKKSHPDMQLIDNQILVRYHVKVEFSTALDYQYFPLDDHRIYIMIAHPFLSIRQAQFETSEANFITKTREADVGWHEISKEVQTGYSQARLNEQDDRITRTYPVALFSVDYERYGIRHLLTIFLPLLLIFYVSLFSLCITKANMRLAIIAVTAMVSYRFVIDRMSPNVDYFMISDYIFFLFLCAGLCIFLLNIINEYASALKERYLQIAIITLHIVVIVLASALLLY